MYLSDLTVCLRNVLTIVSHSVTNGLYYIAYNGMPNRANCSAYLECSNEQLYRLDLYSQASKGEVEFKLIWSVLMYRLDLQSSK